jgi:hypothetical protein
MAAEVGAVLRRLDRPRDWIDELADGGDALKSDEAAHVMGVHVDTARRYAEAAFMAGRPIGIRMAGGAFWLFSLRRILAAIEAEKGLSARLAAESRAKKSRVLRPGPTIIDTNVGAGRTEADAECRTEA